MAAYTDSHGFDKGSAAHPAQGINRVGYMEVNLNFATITADRATAGATALAAGDSIEVLSVPANTLVLAVGATTVTAEGAASTFDIGLTGGGQDSNLLYLSGIPHTKVPSAKIIEKVVQLVEEKINEKK